MQTPPIHDRQLLLHGAKRNAVLELWELQRYGADSYGDKDHVSIYGMRPGEWYAKGLRLLGRTAVECTRDALGDAIGKDVAVISQKAPRSKGTLVIDPFAGSANTLYWILHYLPDARGLGFELDAGVFQLTAKNLAILALPIDILNIDYLSGLAGAAMPTDQLLIVFIAPPWGNAQSFETELDRLKGIAVRRELSGASSVSFVLAFVTRKPEIDSLSKKIDKLAQGDAVVWFAMVAIDEDWSAKRLRRVEFIKTMKRDSAHAMSRVGKVQTRKTKK